LTKTVAFPSEYLANETPAKKKLQLLYIIKANAISNKTAWHLTTQNSFSLIQKHISPAGSTLLNS